MNLGSSATMVGEEMEEGEEERAGDALLSLYAGKSWALGRESGEMSIGWPF